MERRIRPAAFSLPAGADQKRATSTSAQIVEAAVAKLRRVIATVFSAADFERYEAVLGLRSPRTELREGIVEAVYLYFLTTIMVPLRRPSAIRAELKAVEKKAAAAAGTLQELCMVVERLTPAFQDVVRRHWKLFDGGDPGALPELATRLDSLSRIARGYAEDIRDPGGRPRKSDLEALIDGLADAFETATGKRATVTYDPYGERYTGRFLKLVEAVLPDAAAMVCAAAGKKRLNPFPSGKALGEYVRDALKARRKSA